MFWILVAFLAPLFYGIATMFDSYLVNRIFKNPITLVFFSSMTGLLFLPVIFVIQAPQIPTTGTIPLIAALGAINVAYLYPYLKALQSDDTSVVGSFFSLGKVFVPVLAFLFVGEVLGMSQYIGFVIIIIASTLLAYRPGKGVRMNRSFFYMTVVSLLLAVEVVLYKMVFGEVSWSTGFFWTELSTALIVLPMLLSGKYRKIIKDTFPDFRKNFKAFIAEESFTFAGTATFTFAISVASVTVVKGIAAVQPFFVLILTILLAGMFPKIFKEKTDRKSMLKKVLLFALMTFGVLMILMNGQS